MPLVAWSPKTQAPRAHARAALVEVKVQARLRSGPPCKDLAGRCFLTLRIRLSKTHPRAAITHCTTRQSSRPRMKTDETVELIGIEPTTSSLQSWRSTN